MKDIKKMIAAAMSLTMIPALAACGNSGADDPYYDSETTTESVIVTMAEEDAAIVDQIEMDAEPLANPTLRWLSFWSLEPDSEESKDVFLQLFETKYGGKIEWINVDQNEKFKKLGAMVAADDSPDMFPAADLDTFPGRVSAGMFRSMDEYIDFDDELFPEGAKKINEMHTIAGKHYMACVSLTAGNIVFYNKKTIEEYDLPDPAELAYNNEWTWSAFKEMCAEFADPDEGRYGIDGWWFELATMLSTGVPVIGMEDGVLKSNIMSPEIARAQDYFLEINKLNVNVPREQWQWKDRPEYIGQGKTLFYPVGSWKLYDTTTVLFGTKKERMFVPFPRDDESDVWYQGAEGGLDAYAMCKGAPNPEAVAAFIKCKLVANADESVKAIGDKQLREDYGWTDEMIDMFNYCTELTNANPVIDFYNAINDDITEKVHNPIKDSSYNGTNWYTARDSINDSIKANLADVNAKLAALDSE